MHPETFISIDVETTGPVPGLFNMIDLGACVVGDLTNTFSKSMKDDDGVPYWNTQTRHWWLSNDHKRRVLSQIEERAILASHAMLEFKSWLSQFARPVLVGFPAGFDFAFIHYYWWKYLNCEPPFGHRCLDGKTLAWELLRSPTYSGASKGFMHKKFPQGFRKDLPHTHFALDDAMEQAYLFEQLLKLR